MIPFPTADVVWPHGSSMWRLCVLPRPPHERGLQRLLDQAYKVLAPFPLAEVAGADLNIGICPLELPEQDPGTHLRRQVSRALAAHLADLPPFAMPVGPEHVGIGTVALELQAERWPQLTARVGAALGEALEDCEPGPMPTRPHLTIAYGAGHCDSAEIAAALRAATRSERAEVLIDAVHLVRVRQNAPAHQYHLTAPAVTVPIGGTRPVPREGGGPR